MPLRLLPLFLLLLASGLASDKPNVLFIAVDDLNDWVGCLGGHPQAKTPNIDALARNGVLFANAHCAAPLCNPSRTALLFGKRPTTTGVVGNGDDWRTFETLQTSESLPQLFRRNGYFTAAAGKIFHANHGGWRGALTREEGAPYAGRSGFGQPSAWDERFPAKTIQLPMAPVLIGTHRNGIDHHWDWGPIDFKADVTEDGQISRWAVRQLRATHDRPFFLAVGIYRPHDPQYAPSEFFDEHPLETVELPTILSTDLEDISSVARRHVSAANSYEAMIRQHGALRSATRGYLASVTFADAMVGRVLEALESSQYAANTIVVLFSDHGYHIGEKQKYHKSTLWEESTRVPLIVSAPGAMSPGVVSRRAVSLIDVYPTLAELAGLEPPADLDGESLVPLLVDPAAARSSPALTSRQGRHHAIRTDRWRYIRYADGTEELYDHESDPTEWRNLAANPAHAETKRRLSAAMDELLE
ncbi:MAG: sulfatase [Bryobacterales bacterium]|nr:sulfatase [Bryobacterales bacterium]